MQHEPCSLLGHAKITRQLITRNAVLAIREQPDGRPPFIQADGRILEYGADLERELLLRMVAVAAIDVRLCQPSELSSAAIGTLDYSIRPADKNGELAAVLRIGKVLNRLL